MANHSTYFTTNMTLKCPPISKTVAALSQLEVYVRTGLLRSPGQKEPTGQNVTSQRGFQELIIQYLHANYKRCDCLPNVVTYFYHFFNILLYWHSYFCGGKITNDAPKG